ncbi:agmatinase family protein [Baia soyae]|uniref:Formiminoglutamase n=1 Tax=Baia soyae TaxID=1544746 RepID=A0A4R2S1G7_9BACL|nr:agmatinase family protein [Baia soyae]TCP69353.1 formiminoglutamase [Baia soyae]
MKHQLSEVVELPAFHWRETDTVERVSDWICSRKNGDWWDLCQAQNWDVTLLGVPLSRSSISASAASEHPEAFRRMWKYFVPYHVDYDLDLTPLRIVDVGDVIQHTTDIGINHQRIEEAMTLLRKQFPRTFPITIGGDHSITAPLVKGWKRAHPGERIGILQLDTHFDLRPLTSGPSNGTVIRNLIESQAIKGSDVWNIGLHGFYNTKSLRDYAQLKGVRYIPLREARMAGMVETIQRALQQLEQEVDTIYLTVDMDVLDIAYAPGVAAATVGGMRTDELFSAIYEASQHPLVKAMDIVCVDPRKDVAEMTVRAAVHTMMTFLSGFCMRKKQEIL